MVRPGEPEVVMQGKLFSRNVLWGLSPLTHTGSVAGPCTGSWAMPAPGLWLCLSLSSSPWL